MSLYGMMRTGVSGMAAQVSRLSTVADNIANSGTTGYKRNRAEFATLVLQEAPGFYNSGGVTTTIQKSISSQGVLQSTSSVTDLALNGNGFFVVQDGDGSPFLTRAGAFVPDASGQLVNAAGYKLMAYQFENGSLSTTANGFAGLVPVTVSDGILSATPSSSGNLFTNLPSAATAVPAADLPSANGASAAPTAKSSLIAYDNLGETVALDVYSTKTGTNTWEVTIFDQAQATGTSGFPYSAGPLATTTLSFDPANGKLAAGSAGSLSLAVPGGQTLKLDLANTTQLSGSYSVLSAEVNGNAPTAVEEIEISRDGTIFARYGNGTLQSLYRVPLATVPSPDQLQTEKGNVYAESSESGAVRIGFAGEGEFGSIISGSLENSNVDIADELTTMIESQRSYTANSKVFQTGSELMDIIVNLKR